MNTQEKQEINTKIEELKKTIAELEAKVNEPEEQIWEPRGVYYISALGNVETIGRRISNHNSFISKQAALYTAEKLKPIYKLLCYVTEFDKEEYGVKNHSLYKSEGGARWSYSVNTNTLHPDAIMMSKPCAEELVDKLNKGLVKLD